MEANTVGSSEHHSLVDATSSSSASLLAAEGATVSCGHLACRMPDAGCRWTLAQADLIQASIAKGGNGDDAAGSARQKSGALKQELLGLLRKIEEWQFTWPCREPVDPNEVPECLDVVVPNQIENHGGAYYQRTTNKQTNN
jgi:hypothetical protein